MRRLDPPRPDRGGFGGLGNGGQTRSFSNRGGSSLGSARASGFGGGGRFASAGGGGRSFGGGGMRGGGGGVNFVAVAGDDWVHDALHLFDEVSEVVAFGDVG